MNTITFDELIKKVKNHEHVDKGTLIHFGMHDIIRDTNVNVFMHEEFIHIPTNTRILVDYDELLEQWSRTSIILPGMNENQAIWIGDDEEDCWFKATHEDVTCSFDIEAFVELY